MQTLVKNPTTDRVPTVFNSIFDRMMWDAFQNFAQPETRMNANFVPGVDIMEDEYQYEIHFALPGIEKDQITVEVRENTLIVSGERKFEKEEKKHSYHRIETHYGKFSRSFTLPENIKRDSIEAEYKNGMLQLTLPKDLSQKLNARVEVK